MTALVAWTLLLFLNGLFENCTNRGTLRGERALCTVLLCARRIVPPCAALSLRLVSNWLVQVCERRDAEGLWAN